TPDGVASLPLCVIFYKYFVPNETENYLWFRLDLSTPPFAKMMYFEMRVLIVYFFANGGLFFDLDMNNSSPIDSQTGIGGLLGLGAKYDFNYGVSIFVNPYLKFHSLISFSSDDNKQKVHESGFRVGLNYNLNRTQ
ncbi:hypothetical protein JZU61_01600, partial [bacterium]|nr:hypothetical protein [bacterium]